MTFKDRQLNSITCQAWKMKFLNSTTSQVFHDLYEPWISGQVLLFFGGGATRRLGASSLVASSSLAKIPRGSAAARKVGSLRYHDGDDNENVIKALGWISKTTTLHVHHAFMYISLLSLHDYDGKMPNSTFYGGRKQATARFSFSSWTWIWFLGIRLKKSSPAFDKVNELE